MESGLPSCYLSWSLLHLAGCYFLLTLLPWSITEKSFSTAQTWWCEELEGQYAQGHVVDDRTNPHHTAWKGVQKQTRMHITFTATNPDITDKRGLKKKGRRNPLDMLSYRMVLYLWDSQLHFKNGDPYSWGAHRPYYTSQSSGVCMIWITHPWAQGPLHWAPSELLFSQLKQPSCSHFRTFIVCFHLFALLVLGSPLGLSLNNIFLERPLLITQLQILTFVGLLISTSF